MQEYVETFRTADDTLHVYANTRVEDDLPTAEYYLCVRRIPPGLRPGIPVGFVNTEQLTILSKLTEYNSIIDTYKPTEIFDYSLENIAIVGKGVYLPYTCYEAETQRLRSFLSAPKEFDVCVLGTPSAARTAFVERLTAAGIRVDYIRDAFGDERDVRVAKSRILLNVHYAEEYKIYESIRCERWRVAGMPVVTEECAGLDHEKRVGVCTLETVVDVIKGTLLLLGS
jgi:hypothetical protein